MSKNNGRFLRRRVACQKTMAVFCAAGSSVKKQRVFSAPQGQASKNNEFFLRPRVKRQKTTSFFCARGSSVKKQRCFPAYRKKKRVGERVSNLFPRGKQALHAAEWAFRHAVLDKNGLCLDDFEPRFAEFLPNFAAGIKFLKPFVLSIYLYIIMT